MEIKENIVCLYTAGLSGTWLTWFINQHASFPQYTSTKLKSYGSITDLACNGATWCFTKDVEDGASDEPKTFDEYMNDWAVPESNNNLATKNCCKVLPDHDLSWDHDEAVLRNVMKPFNRIIVPYLLPDSPFVDMYAKRNRYMWHANFDNDFGIDDYTDMILGVRQDIARGHYLKFNKSVHNVNLHNLLMCDQWEYDNLLSIIDEDPINGWEHHVNDYRTRFICRDWDAMYNKIDKDNETNSK